MEGDCDTGTPGSRRDSLGASLTAYLASLPPEFVTTRLPEYPGTNRHRSALLLGLFLVLTVRLLTLPAVFQDGGIVLSSNDPYYYRYWVDVLNAGGWWPWDLPPSVATGEPLFVTVLWLGSILFGGDRFASGFVLAWYPVLSALVTGYLVYALGARVSGNAAVGLASLLFFAVTPAHAIRTSLGFADHHAFDYPWLVLTLYALVVLLDGDALDRKSATTSAILGIGLAGQVLAWEAGPLLVVPVGFAVAGGTLVFLTTDRERSSVRFDGPSSGIALGVGFGATLVLAAHLALGWHTRVIVYSMGVLFVGVVGVLVLVRVAQMAGLSTGQVLLIELIAIGAGLLLVIPAVPDLSLGVQRGLAFLGSDTRIGEMSSIGSHYGPVRGMVILLGLAPFLALGAIPLAVRDGIRSRNPGWVAVLVYVGYFSSLAVVQRRFAGELAPVLSVLAGLGLGTFLAWVGVVGPSNQDVAGSAAPDESGPQVRHSDRTRLSLLGGLLGVVVGNGALFTGLISRRVTIDPAAFRTAVWMREYAREHSLTYPDNYVLSEWGRNRMYNYVVNGHSRSYDYARRHYEAFLFTSDAEGWYEEFAGRVGFVVTRDFESVGDLHPFRLLSRLHGAFGSATAEAPGVGHFRAVYSSPEGTYNVFTLVPGARITGRVQSDGATEISTDVSIAGAEFDYSRRIDTEANGTFSVTVAHPGEYRLGDRRVQVAEEAVRTGRTLRLATRSQDG
ncbi:MAG: STT3 domain-containing protein [Halodesulfurarchaeum sp.]